MLCNVIQTLLSIRSSPFSPVVKWHNIINYFKRIRCSKGDAMGLLTPMLNNFQSMCVDDTLVLIQYAHGRIVQIDFADIHGGMDDHS